jgi:hypothetical protein
MDKLSRTARLAQKKFEMENPIPENAEYEGQFIDEDGDIPDDDEEVLTPSSLADDLGNIIGEPQEVFAVGRAPLPTDDDGNVTDTDENGHPLPRDKDGNLLGTGDPL